jgi:tetratricopeptide (TPR) repeat protein
MKTSKAAAAAIALLGGAAFLAGPASAQYAPQPRPTMPEPRQQAQPPAPSAQPAAPTRNYNLTRAERTAFQPVIVAINAADWAAATAALPAAIAAVRGNDAKYLVGQVRLQIGIGTNNTQLQSQGVDEMLASGGALPTELRALYENQLSFANAAGDTAKAQRALAQLDALNPNDPGRFVRQARIRVTASDWPGAIALYQQAMQAQQAIGQPIPVEWRQQIAGLAYRARQPQTVGYMREWLVAAPTPALWHDTLAIYGELGSANSALKLDIYRLMRAAGAMNSERDFVELSEAANEARAFGEVKAVLEEGLRRNLITANTGYARDRIGLATRRITDDRASLAGERTSVLAGRDGAAALRLGDAYFGYGEYGPAAELYRAAVQKGGADASLANTRLGAALALAGQRAEAEAAFRAVTGPRAELAQFWLLWLSTRG